MSAAISVGEALGVCKKHWNCLAPFSRFTSATGATTGSSTSVIELAVLLGSSRRQSEVERVTLDLSRDWAERRITDAEYQALLEVAQRRRTDIRTKANLHHARYGVPRRYAYSRTASEERRRGLIRLGVVPGWLANCLTPGEEAVAAVILQDISHHGYCDKFNGDLAALAGCCERLVIRTKARLVEMTQIRIARRPRRHRRSDSTILTAASSELKRWLRDRRQRSSLGEWPCCVHQNIDIQEKELVADEGERYPQRALDCTSSQAAVKRYQFVSWQMIANHSESKRSKWRVSP